MKPAPPVTRILMLCLRVSTRSQALGAPASDRRVCGKLQTLATLQAIERAMRLSTLPWSLSPALGGARQAAGGPGVVIGGLHQIHHYFIYCATKAGVSPV